MLNQKACPDVLEFDLVITFLLQKEIIIYLQIQGNVEFKEAKAVLKAWSAPF
jgi:hypothetical protein